MLRKILNECRNILMFRLRYPWVNIGKDVHCQRSVSFCSPSKDVRIGDHVGIGGRCIFIGTVHIGSHVLIAPQVAFLNSDDHRYDIVGQTMWDSPRGDNYKIVIEDDVWIGHGVIILSPARIGRGSVIAAGSVVTRDVPRYGIVAGVPAKLLKMRFTPEQIARHEAALIEQGVIDPDDLTATDDQPEAQPAS